MADYPRGPSLMDLIASLALRVDALEEKLSKK